VQQVARGGDAESPGADRLGGQAAHFGQIVRGRRFLPGAALAHDKDPQGGVRQLGGDVDIQRALVEGVEVLREGLPVPRQTLGHHHLGDVLDPFHQLDQHLMLLGPAGGEADAAVAHDHRGDPVVGGLAVVVGVDVDESGGDQLAGRVDLLGRGAVNLAHGGDAAVQNGDIADEGGAAEPVVNLPAPDDQVVVGHGLVP
jgi:hypothetical protein